ncbi:hypothetical protein JI752_014975 [Lysobacter sp. MMG2]|uniref:hypothetical protein n=1 Tax=Lysobacter sp. MMG2 TaxID=2801338 RepID=UPI001C21C20A|nr:hypothetical protein [Lysobacter sp. MMG2]MBU8977451.1 hypothetical protein [Lysobacter sp. MMG2]
MLRAWIPAFAGMTVDLLWLRGFVVAADIAVAVAVEQPFRSLAPKGAAHGCAAVSAEPGMANRERAYSLSGRGIGLGKWKALSFGYFSLGKQRKVTRAA